MPSFMHKTYSMPDLTLGPSFIRGKKANEPFYGTERQFGFKVWDGKMTGGQKAREGFAGTSPLYGRGWRHGCSFGRK